MAMSSSPITTIKWVWWIFLLFAPVIAIMLLGVGSSALPVGLVSTSIPVYLTHRLLQNEWKTRTLVMPLFAGFAVAAVLLAFADPSQRTAMYIPSWVPSVLGFYFMSAPLLITSCVLVELHRVRL